MSDLSRVNVAIIDVLRATSSMVVAIASGCKGIYPVESIEQARDRAAGLASQRPLLAGERNGLRPQGFDLGNSPAEFTPERVAQKVLVLATSNGSPIFNLVDSARRVFAASFLNLSMTAEGLAYEHENVLIICAGTDRAPSLEDTACGGALAHRIRELVGSSCQLSDAAIVARNSFVAYPDILTILYRSSHGKYLEEAGLGSDLETCARRDRFPILLIQDKGIVTRSPMVMKRRSTAPLS